MPRVILSLVLAVFGLVAAPVAALDAPEGAVVLTVTGTGDAPMPFDRAMLEALDWREIETFTSFTEGPQRFAGPTLASLLEALGVRDGTLRATAVNDYSVEIPAAHAWQHDVILAMDHGGQAMRVRDKGPIWVVYPLTEADAAAQPFDSEMIWQLVRLDILR